MSEECSRQDVVDQKATRTRDAEQERRLRQLADRCGFELICPWGFHPGRIGEAHKSYTLVAHGSGMSLDEIERVLREKVK